MARWVFLILVGSLLAGCGAKPPPDPNDPRAVGIMQPEVLQRNLKWASEMINDRVAKGEVTDGEGQKLLAKYANELVEKVDFKQMNASQAWKYGDVFRTAQRWELAERALTMAVDHAKKTKNEDRRVNDTLRLAQTQAQLGKRKEAMDLVRTTFDAADKDKAPILMATLYEVAPAVEGHGLDADLARLLEEAIAQHNQVVIDPETDSGKAFLAARGHHLRNAWVRVIQLYRSANKMSEADAARKRADEMLSQQGRL